MEKHITVIAANDSECTIFVKHIVMIQKVTSGIGAFVYTNTDKAIIRTKETYEDVLKLIKEA
jgi:hypothetical protein